MHVSEAFDGALFPDSDLITKLENGNRVVISCNRAEPHQGTVVIAFDSDTDARRIRMSGFTANGQSEAVRVADSLFAIVLPIAIRLDATEIVVDRRGIPKALEEACANWGLSTDSAAFEYVLRLDIPTAIYRTLNLHAYEGLADEYRLRSDDLHPDERTPRFLADLLLKELRGRSKTKVLELGPGSGSVLKELSASAHQCVAVELSPRMAATAARAAPDAVVMVADILDVEFPDDHFDGVYAGAFIHLFPENHSREVLRRIRAWLKPSGVLFVSTTVSEPIGSGLEVKADYERKVVRFRSRWDSRSFTRMLTDCGYTIVHECQTKASSRRKNWIAYICRPA